ncbi:phage major capsid protein [Caedibacter taeniospiralis]|uniref:phage major capsid protein n=1 Tax=Caedibacter taeniospiralis TaxID=28907 RepID=UPI000C2779E3|nr:phage major capsid protein [Caedibacter taeniospiralis]
MQNYIKTIKEAEILTRDYTFNATHSKIDMDKRTVELSFSSNTPYQRWQDANEVLEHHAGAIDLTRLNNKGALLINHDWNRQIGVVEHAYIDGDKARAVVKFSKRQEAQDFFQDVQDGIIANVSVGYKVDEAEPDATNKAVRVTHWQPFEISLVSVPADVTVGIGRNFAQSCNDEAAKLDAVLDKVSKSKNNPEGERMSNDVKEVKEVKTESQITRSFDEGIKNERERIAKIDALARKFNQAEFARSYIEGGKPFEQFERDFVEHVQWVQEKRERMTKLESNSPQVNAVQSCANNIGMNDKETREFSLSRAVRALVNPFDMKAREAASFEFEASDAAKRKLGINDDSLMIPPDVLQRDFSIATGRNALVPTQLQSSSFIDMLRNKSIMLSIARRLSGLRGNVDIPRQVEGSNIYWVGEKQDVGEGKLTTDQVHLTPKTLGAYLEVSRMLMINSSLDAETMVRNDLLAAVALGIDTAALYGTGSNHQPLGLTGVSGITAVEYAGDNPTLADYIGLETSIALQNADVANMRYLLNPALRGAAKTTPRLPGSEMTVWEPGNTINGYSVEVSNQIKPNQVIFGDFSQLIVGLWDGLRLTVNPYSLDKSGGIRLVVMQSVDFAVRRPESFAIANKK